THKTDGVLLQSDWVLGNDHLIAGVDAWQKRLDSIRDRVVRIDVLNPQGQVAKSISQITVERPIPVATYRSVGLFAQNEFPNVLNNRLKLTLGGRVDKIFVDNDAAMQPLYQVVDGVRNDAPAGQFPLWSAQKVENFSWSGNLSLLYHVSRSVDLTATAARSFRSPYLEERYQYIDQGNLVKIGDPQLKPERGLFADVGVRFYHGEASLSANAFINRIQDMVVEAPAIYEGRQALKKTNVGSAELYGFDFQMNAPLTRSLRATAGAAYVHGQDTYLDEPLPLIPPASARAGLEAALGRLATVELVATVYGDQKRIASWERGTPGSAVFDLYVSSMPIRFGGLRSRLFVSVENLLDRAYRNHLATNRGSITVEPGRNIILRLQSEF
ncbi:MAG: TonB-dependent receptor, partial [candidate division KSB1 bacterium]|nr:TonB-dependent receptor [candidate division KSB1 bacterium]